MHLFAQQALVGFIQVGALYVELRGSPDGYVNPKQGFGFADACACIETAFSQAQQVVLGAVNGDQTTGSHSWLASLILGERYALERLPCVKEPANPLDKRLVCKVSLLFVGKRHKPVREMILEAAAAAVRKPAASQMVRTAGAFAKTELGRCRVVGFDLAGAEVGRLPTDYIPANDRTKAKNR